MRLDEAKVQEISVRDSAAMLEAMGRGVAQALQKHQDLGVPIITWDAKAQRIVEVPAADIPAWIKATTPTQ